MDRTEEAGIKMEGPRKSTEGEMKKTNRHEKRARKGKVRKGDWTGERAGKGLHGDARKGEMRLKQKGEVDGRNKKANTGRKAK